MEKGSKSGNLALAMGTLHSFAEVAVSFSFLGCCRGGARPLTQALRTISHASQERKCQKNFMWSAGRNYDSSVRRQRSPQRPLFRARHPRERSYNATIPGETAKRPTILSYLSTVYLSPPASGLRVLLQKRGAEVAVNSGRRARFGGPDLALLPWLRSRKAGQVLSSPRV